MERAYMLFRALGLRHLVVVDAAQHVKGILTRKVGLHPCQMELGYVHVSVSHD